MDIFDVLQKNCFEKIHTRLTLTVEDKLVYGKCICYNHLHMKKPIIILLCSFVLNSLWLVNVQAAIGTSHAVVGHPTYRGTQAVTEAYFDFPEGITADKQGNLYIADTQNNVIRKIDTATGLVDFVVGNGSYGDVLAGKKKSEFAHPAGVAVDNDNNIYIADTGNNKIKKFADGNTSTIISNVNAPIGIAVVNNTLYFTETTTNSLFASNLDGSNQHLITNALPGVNYLAVRSTNDYAYVLINTSEIIRVTLQTGTLETIAQIGNEDFTPTLQGITLVEGNALSADDLFVTTDNSIMLIDPDISFKYSYTNNRGKVFENNAVVRTYIALQGSNNDDSLRNSYFGATAPWEMEMNSAHGLAIINNVLYIANTGGGQIYTGTIPNLSQHDYLNPAWNYYAGKNRFQSIDGTPGYPGRPKDLVFSKDKKTIYFSENNQIKKLSLPDKNITSIVGNTIDNYPKYDEPEAVGTAGRFSDPSSITLSPDETKLYVVDRNNNRIRIVNIINNSVIKLTGYGLTNTTGGQYNIYQEGDACIAIKGTTYENNTCAMFSHPYGIAMDPAGNYVYVSDTDNQIIRKVEITGDNAGKTSLLAGTPVTTGFADGLVNTAKFNAPTGLTIDDAGEYLYVADRDNHALRKIRINDGYVTTVAGAPERRGETDGTVATGTMNLPVEVNWYKNKLYFTDASKSLRKINLKKNTLETISGNGKPGYKNGNSTETEFAGILGIALKGRFAFVSDYQNDTIRKVKIK